MTNHIARYRIGSWACGVLFMLQTVTTITQTVSGAQGWWCLVTIPVWYLILQLFLAWPRALAKQYFESKNLAFIP